MNTARIIVENKINNDLIYKELDYYKKHKVVLGNHPIFKHYQEIRTLRKLNTGALIKKYDNNNKSISRYQVIISKNKKPELILEHKRLLAEKETLKNELEQLLREYNLQDLIKIQKNL